MSIKNSNDIIGKGVGESETKHQLLADFKKVYDPFLAEFGTHEKLTRLNKMSLNIAYK